MFNNMKNKGFTLVETLVAITILLIAIAGPLTIAAKGLNGAFYARDQIIAYYLAQEGIEYVRNVRDTNSLNHLNWITGGLASGSGLNNCINSYCRINVLDQNPATSVSSCVSDTTNNPLDSSLHCKALTIDSGPGGDLYNYTGSTATQFTRDIIITNPDPSSSGIINLNTHELQITSTVSWRSPLPDHSFSLTEDITNWQQ